jgi:hypothetical protein
MPWGKEDNFKEQCPCAQCASLLPTPTMVSNTTRCKHKNRYGLPGDEEASACVEDESKDLQGPDVLPAAPVLESPPVETEVDQVAFAKDLVLLVINHGISWKAVELVVKLVNSHVRGRTLIKNLPATAYQLKKITACRPGSAKLVHVCPVCDFVFDGDQQLCTPCGLPPRMRHTRQMLLNDVKITIRQMFGVPRIAEAFEYAYHRKPGDGDVWDGSVMQGIPLGTHAAVSNYLILQEVSYDNPRSND